MIVKVVSASELIAKDQLYIGDGYRAKNSELSDSGYPFARAGNLNNGFQFKNADYIPLEDIKKIGVKKSHVGDIAFTSKGTIGRFGFVSRNTPEFVYSPQICFWRSLDHSILWPRYLYYWMNSRLFLDQVSMVSGQTDMALYVNLKDQRRMHLHVPDLPTQRKIASILSAYDDLIENNNQRIKLLEDMAEEIYKEWFVRLRFPATKNSPGWKESKFFDKDGKEVPHGTKGALPEGWELIRVSEAFEVLGGGTPSTEVSEYWKGEVSWFSPTDITGSPGLFPNSSKKITELGLRKSSAKLFPPKSVMMTSRATIGAVGINLTEACTNQGFITFIPNESFTYPYLYLWLKLNKPMFVNFSSGATFKEISRGVFKKLKILKLSKPVASKFFKTIEPLFDELRVLQEKNQLLAETRDLLLPRLISGKLSVEKLNMANTEAPLPAPNG